MPGSVAEHLPRDVVALPVRDQLPPIELELVWRTTAPPRAAQTLIDAARSLAVVPRTPNVR